jgi:hypothetical protein
MLIINFYWALYKLKLLKKMRLLLRLFQWADSTLHVR